MLEHLPEYLRQAGAGGLAEILAHFAAFLAAEGLAESRVGRPELDRYLYTLALEGANSARLDAAVGALKGYFGFRAALTGASDPAAGLSFFGSAEDDREKYIRTEWGLSDAFYGILPDRGRGGDA